MNLFILLSLSSVLISTPVKQIRSDFRSIMDSEKQLWYNIASLGGTTDNTLLGYRGLFKATYAQYVLMPTGKLSQFKKGKADLELAIKNEPNNIELRHIRLMIQANAPSFLGYNKEIDQDYNLIIKSLESHPHKEFIIDNLLHAGGLSNKRLTQLKEKK